MPDSLINEYSKFGHKSASLGYRVSSVGPQVNPVTSSVVLFSGDLGLDWWLGTSSVDLAGPSTCCNWARFSWRWLAHICLSDTTAVTPDSGQVHSMGPARQHQLRQLLQRFTEYLGLSQADPATRLLSSRLLTTCSPTSDQDSTVAIETFEGEDTATICSLSDGYYPESQRDKMVRGKNYIIKGNEASQNLVDGEVSQLIFTYFDAEMVWFLIGTLLNVPSSVSSAIVLTMIFSI
ncbi:unnamed protein product [Protopolystoma xenopodis]|uniref:Uncharacterized protein n=1 Tax=Protopolystoma xenopodis TaxID=117903 RepID=A0A448XHN9_9PLAT|nr:unnamed protein product [Protopolystoma xenopodis]